MKSTLLALSITLGLGAVSAQAASLTKSSASPQANAPAAACPTGPGFLTYNTDCTPVAGTIACGGTNLVTTAENSYYRRYVLSANSVPNVTIATVRLGIETANGAGIAGLMVKLYTIPNGTPLTTGALTPIGSAAIPVSSGAALSEIVVPISPAAVVDTPATKNIVVELFEPDLTAASSSVVFGSNATGGGVTYLRAPACGAAQPVDIASLGAFSNIKIIASLAGDGLPVELQEYSVD